MSMKYIEEMSRKGISYKKYSSEFGAKILGKFGWKEGEGLGKTKTGITEAIQIKRREENMGLGKKKKEVVWNDKWWEQSYDNILKGMKTVNNIEQKEGGYNLRKSSMNSAKERKESVNSFNNNKKERKISISSNHKKKENSKGRKNSKDSINTKKKSLLSKKRKITFIDI